MKIYKIKRTDWADFDENKAHVIVANSETEVIQLAKNNIYRDEPESVWDTAEISCIGIYSGPEKEPHIVLSDNVGA